MSENREAVSIVPLINFDSDMELLRLHENLCIRRIDFLELEKIRDSVPVGRPTIKDVLMDTDYVIAKKMKVDSVSEWRETSTHVSDIVLTLRLLKTGDVGTPTAFLLDSEDRFFYVSNTSPQLVTYENIYFLEQKETGGFIKLWKKLQKLKEEKSYLEFSLVQFTRALEEEFAEDAIVDVMTAFESIVFHRGKESPRPYGRAIGIAIGMLLGKNEGERAKIETEFETAYEMRNAIVHGHLRKRLRNYDEKRVSQLSVRVEDYLRRTLRRFLKE